METAGEKAPLQRQEEAQPGRRSTGDVVKRREFLGRKMKIFFDRRMNCRTGGGLAAVGVKAPLRRGEDEQRQERRCGQGGGGAAAW